jgi:hypothetical protein
MLQNGSFSEGWETLEPVAEANWLRNQRPFGWQIEWLQMGEPLYTDPGNKARGIPECVHKLSEQLPEDERMGGKHALILEGSAVYKIFSGGGEFGATLSQKITLAPMSRIKVVVPIQVHTHGDPDPYGAESAVWLSQQGGGWANSDKMGDRKWYRHEVEHVVPADGEIELIIRVKSKWPRAKDFFFDGVTLEILSPGIDPVDDPGDDPMTVKTVTVRLPDGVQVKQGVCDEANVV